MSEIQHHPVTELHPASTSSHQAPESVAVRVARRGWRRPAVLVGVAAATLVAVGVGAVASSSSADLGQSAFAVSPAVGVADAVRVRIVDTSAEAKQMTEQLHAQGLDVTVQTMPAVRQVVGTWVSVGSDGSPAAENAYDGIIAQTMGYTSDVVLPRGISGLTLTVAVAPSAGEAPAVLGLRNAFAPGGALACSPARGVPAEQAVQILEQGGYTPQTVSFPSLEPVIAAPGDIATMAYYDDASPKTIQLVVLAPGDRRAAPQLASGFSPSQAAAGTCS